MTTKVFTSREFNQDVAAVKRASTKGPVVITDRGKPAHVVMSYETYERLANNGPSLAEALGDPAAAEVPFELDLPVRETLREIEL